MRILNVLACAALKDDVILLLHQDRREHVLMNYAFDIDRLPLLQQKALGLFVSGHFSADKKFLFIVENLKLTIRYWLLGKKQQFSTFCCY